MACYLHFSGCFWDNFNDVSSRGHIREITLSVLKLLSKSTRYIRKYKNVTFEGIRLLMYTFKNNWYVWIMSSRRMSSAVFREHMWLTLGSASSSSHQCTSSSGMFFLETKYIYLAILWTLILFIYLFTGLYMFLICFYQTFRLSVMGLSQELSDLVRGNGERNPRCYLQRVDSDHFTILQKQSQCKCKPARICSARMSLCHNLTVIAINACVHSHVWLDTECLCQNMFKAHSAHKNTMP